MRLLSTEAPSLPRHYPASSVLRAPPPPRAARPDSHESPVDPTCDHSWGFPCCAWSPLSARRRQYPGRTDGADSLVLSHRPRPSLDSRRVGSCITRFGACTAFTFVTAYRLAKSPKRPSTPEASAASSPPLLLRLLPGGANQFPGGFLPPTEDQRLFTAHAKVRLRSEQGCELCSYLVENILGTVPKVFGLARFPIDTFEVIGQDDPRHTMPCRYSQFRIDIP